MEPPEQCRPGRDFDQAVQAEADQGDGPGDQPGDDGDQTFGAVVGDGEVFELTTPANKMLAMDGSGVRHALSGYPGMILFCHDRLDAVTSVREPELRARGALRVE